MAPPSTKTRPELREKATEGYTAPVRRARGRGRHGVPPKAERPLCGARCRSKRWEPCAARVCVRPDGRGLARRCRMHGGLSTGARTPEGRARLREAGRRGAAERWRRWREGRDRPENP